ncbi:MAG TPA: TIGR03619 family F420-dependent LLM class oxidoreductase [Acidimicrobiales bacterium]|jgi:probable F420-dependent oxidoreductase|nr:TIGR03619 family F420-dependent LLM class oxidoreductase [Acidimicrobiales bacterium]
MTSIVPPGALAYGMQLPVQAQSELFVADWERTSGPDELVAIAQKADETGFFYVAVCDHVAIPDALAPKMGTTWYDTIATLGFLASATTRVRLLSHVWVPAYRHWRQTVKSFTTLDHLSKGRAVLGVGAGHVEAEFGELGVDFAARGRLLDEAIARVRAGLDSEFVDGFGAKPRPSQARVPIWVGGSSPAAVRRAARLGDGWLPQGTPKDQMPASIELLRSARESAGRGDDPIDIGTIHMDFISLGPSGTQKADEVAEALLAFRDMGVNHVQIRFRAASLDELLDQMDRFGAEVAPSLSAG